MNGYSEKGAKPLFEGTGFTREQEEEAQDYLEKRRAELRTERVFGKKAVATFAEVVLDYLEHGEGSNRFVAPLLEHFKDTPLRNIGQHEIDKASVKLYPNVSPSTRGRQCHAVMSAILHHAASRGFCDKPHIKRPSQSKGVECYLKPAEAERFIAACNEPLRTLVIFQLYTGARPAESLWITWSDVDLDMRQATFRDTKNGETRSVPLNSRVMAALEALTHREGEVFRTPSGAPYAPLNEEDDRDTSAGSRVKTAFAAARERSGITRRFRLYDLRHTWASWHYQRHRDLAALMKLGGWKSVKMVLRYAHTNVENHAASMEDLPGVNSVKPVSEVA